MTVSLWLDSREDKAKEEFDVFIVGAGITGASAAYWLSRRPDLKIGIIESGTAAGAASGRNGGFVMRGVMPYYNKLVKNCGREKARELLHFNEQTLAYLAEFAEKHGNSFSYENCGSYLLAASIEELQDLCESAELMKEDGFTLAYFKDDPIDRGFYGALLNPQDAGVNPFMLVKALLAASTVTLYENEQIFRIDWENNQALLHTQKRLISAARVLLCTNAYLPLLVPDLSLPLKPARGQVLVTRPLEERFLSKLCYANYGLEYFRQLTDGRLLLGGCREHFPQEEENYADAATTEVQTALQNYLKDHFPELAGEAIDYRWSGTMCLTEDGLPILGELNELPGVLYLTGCNGRGLGYSFSLARLLVEFALDGKSPGIFDSRRFQIAAKH